MVQGPAFPAKVRKRGNPNWGHAVSAVPALPTEFEKKARQLGLTPKTYVHSSELRAWCERHRNELYIPEWLLEAWGMSVEPNLVNAG